VTNLRPIRPLHAARFCVATAASCRSAPPWHHRTPSVPRAAPTVRAAERSRDHAVFRRESFARLPAVEPGVCPGSNPPRLSAGRASRKAASSDVLCRPSSWRRAFHFRLLAARIPLRFCIAATTRARAVLPACRLEHASLSTQNAFDRLHPSQRLEVVSRLFNSRCTSGHPEHPFASFGHPPVTVVGRRCPLPLLVSRAAVRRRRPSERKAPVANLCNRLVVNEHLLDRSSPER
jgi:hypothetical protein